MKKKWNTMLENQMQNSFDNNYGKYLRVCDSLRTYTIVIFASVAKWVHHAWIVIVHVAKYKTISKNFLKSTKLHQNAANFEKNRRKSENFKLEVT